MQAASRTSLISTAVAIALLAVPALAADRSSDSTHAMSSSSRMARSSPHDSSTATTPDVGRAMDLMVKADTNKDGVVTREEVQKLDPNLAQHFDQADTNHDGKLNLKEFEKLLAYRDQEMGHAAMGSTSAHTPRSSTMGGSAMSRERSSGSDGKKSGY